VLATILYSITNDSIIEPINAVSPDPVTNTYFTKTIRKVLSHTSFTLPAFIARSVFGKELADSLFLSSTRVIPRRLLKGGYKLDFQILNQHLGIHLVCMLTINYYIKDTIATIDLAEVRVI
jgi:NAD dependent epimerase/dehydratase family enzyme